MKQYIVAALFAVASAEDTHQTHAVLHTSLNSSKIKSAPKLKLNPMTPRPPPRHGKMLPKLLRVNVLPILNLSSLALPLVSPPRSSRMTNAKKLMAMQLPIINGEIARKSQPTHSTSKSPVEKPSWPVPPPSSPSPHPNSEIPSIEVNQARKPHIYSQSPTVKFEKQY